MKELMTIAHVMNEMEVSRTTVHRWVQRGWIKTKKIGRLVRITRASLEQLKKKGATL